MHIIGLTGGAATGKSTASRILKDLGAYIIDVDLIGREVMERESPCLKKVAAQFGEGILLPSGDLNRKKLGDIVFADQNELRRLNAIVHPVMVEKVKEQLKILREERGLRTAVVDAAILIEMGLNRLTDCVWLIWVDRKTQLERLMARKGMTFKKAKDIMASQMSMEEKRRYADVIIENTGTMEELALKIHKLWEKR